MLQLCTLPALPPLPPPRSRPFLRPPTWKRPHSMHCSLQRALAAARPPACRSADWSGPYSWTKTTGGSAPGAEVEKGSLGGQGGERYTWRYRLPTGVSCTRCVLQVGGAVVSVDAGGKAAAVPCGPAASSTHLHYVTQYITPPSLPSAPSQWWWTTANSCRVPGAPAWVGSDPGMLSCTDRNTHPEEFRNW